MGISKLWNPYPDRGQPSTPEFLGQVVGVNTRCRLKNIQFNKPGYTLTHPETRKTLIHRSPVHLQKYQDWWFNCNEFGYDFRNFARKDALKSEDFEEAQQNLKALKTGGKLPEGALLYPWAVGYCWLDRDPSDLPTHALNIIQDSGPLFDTWIIEPQKEHDNIWMAKDLLARGTKFLELEF